MHSPKEAPSKPWLSRRAWREGPIPNGSLRPLFWWGLAAIVGIVLPLEMWGELNYKLKACRSCRVVPDAKGLVFIIGPVKQHFVSRGEPAESGERLLPRTLAGREGSLLIPEQETHKFALFSRSFWRPGRHGQSAITVVGYVRFHFALRRVAVMP